MSVILDQKDGTVDSRDKGGVTVMLKKIFKTGKKRDISRTNRKMHFEDLNDQRDDLGASNNESIISGFIGCNDNGHNVNVELNDDHPAVLLYGMTGSGKTRLLHTFVQSVMTNASPSDLRVAIISYGSDFDYLKSSLLETSNPFMYCEPASIHTNMVYAQAVIKQMVKETKRRIEILKKSAATTVSEYNSKNVDTLPEILLVIDHYTEIKVDDEFDANEMLAFLVRFGRVAGIRMVYSERFARYEDVPAVMNQDIVDRISLKLSNPFENEVAMWGSKIDLTRIEKQGEFYASVDGDTKHPMHGYGLYMSNQELIKLNHDLTVKFYSYHYGYDFKWNDQTKTLKAEQKIFRVFARIPQVDCILLMANNMIQAKIKFENWYGSAEKANVFGVVEVSLEEAGKVFSNEKSESTQTEMRRDLERGQLIMHRKLDKEGKSDWRLLQIINGWYLSKLDGFQNVLTKSQVALIHEKASITSNIDEAEHFDLNCVEVEKILAKFPSSQFVKIPTISCDRASKHEYAFACDAVKK